MAAASREECSICMDSFKNPKLTSCNHTFCYQCLEDYVGANLCDGRFDCPVCRTSVALPKDGVSGFRSNPDIDDDCDVKETHNNDDGKESADENNKCEKYPCDICVPSVLACYRCLDCEENFCQVCSNVHEKSKATRHHKIGDLGTLDQKAKGAIRQKVFCTRHPAEEIKLVCKKCNVMMCVLCIVVNHDTHSTKTIADAADQEQKEIETGITKCTAELRRLDGCLQTGEELETRINDAEQIEIQAVESQHLQLKTLLDHEAANLTDKIKIIYGELRKDYLLFISGVQNKSILCSTAKENATKIISHGTTFEKVEKGPIHQRLIAEALSKTVPSPPRLERKLFSPSSVMPGQLVSFFGDVKDSTEVVQEDTDEEEPEDTDEEEPEDTGEEEPEYTGEEEPFQFSDTKAQKTKNLIASPQITQFSDTKAQKTKNLIASPQIMQFSDTKAQKTTFSNVNSQAMSPSAFGSASNTNLIASVQNTPYSNTQGQKAKERSVKHIK